MALADLRQGYKNSAWFTSNPTLVLKQGQVVHLLQTGQYKLGDGTTQLSALSFLGSTPVTGFVPYIGATANVDLGTHNMSARSFNVTGVNGNGHIHLKHQSIDAGSTGSSTTLFADVNGNLAYKNDGNPYVRFISHTNTADRSYTLPNANGTIALTSDLGLYLLASTAASTYQPLLGFTAENVANKAVDFVTANHTLYPSVLAVKAYVDNLVDGVDYKQNVDTVATTNVTLSGLQNINGVTGVAGLPILLIGQSNPTENGCYLMDSGAWVRRNDSNSGLELEYAVYTVTRGTLAGRVYRCNTSNITLGTTALVFQEWNVASYTNGAGLSLSGNTFSIANGGVTAAMLASTTGSGAVVLATSPTIQTLLSVNGQALVTDGTATTRIGAYGANQSAIWFNQTTPTTANYALYGSATQTFFNATSLIGLAINDSSTITINSSAMNVINGKNITFGTTTGTRIGTATNQLFGFWNATPVSRPAAVTTVQGLYDALSSIGLIASGTISASSLISGTANVNFVNQTVKEITINTTSVLTTSRILITFAMASTKDMDELDFYNPFVTYGKIVNGTSFNVRVCLDAPTTNNFKIDYQIIN
ncbi:MAG: hypothetical protein IM600_18765 [Bacteroidetes bacterium]|nr:hypothetical protein [Bacteroidota bacterium]